MCFGCGRPRLGLDPIVDRRKISELSPGTKEMLGLNKEPQAPIGGDPELMQGLEWVTKDKKEAVDKIIG